MVIQRTLSIIKPDATSKNIIGKIIDRFEESGLKIIAGKLIHMDKEKAAGFYAEHDGKPFFPNLVEYMTSAPVFVQVLEGDNAVSKKYLCCDLVSTVRGTRIAFLSISWSNVKIDWGLKSPTSATTSPLLTFDKSTDFWPVISPNLNSRSEWIKNG